jgi:hypothetical protein
VRLRYIGPAPTTFMTHGVGEVDTGGEFEVPDNAGDGFLARPDVEPVPDPPRPLTKGRKQDPQAPPASAGGQTTDDTELTT